MKKKSHFLAYILFTIFIICFILLSIVVIDGYEMYKDAIKTVSIDDKVDEIVSKHNYLPYEKIPQDFINAVVAVEDHRFFNHNGVDYISIGRALLTNIQSMSFSEGGSTLTQQLAKNLYFSQKKKLSRKVAELFVTFELEQKYTKQEIIAMYINISYFGDRKLWFT